MPSGTVSDGMILKQIAFALAVGVLLDAFVVRMTLVPAVLALTGRAAWWLPGRLDRRLPNLDIEGEGLRGKQEEENATRVATGGDAGGARLFFSRESVVERLSRSS